MSPIDPPHDDAVDELIAWSFEVLPRGAVWVRVQGSIGIPEFDSQPQPDFVVDGSAKTTRRTQAVPRGYPPRWSRSPTRSS